MSDEVVRGALSLEDQSIFKPKRKTPIASVLGVLIVALVALGVVLGLMWQSQSLIARIQDIRSDAAASSSATLK